MPISRKDFLRITLTFGGVSAAAALTGCGSDTTPTATDTGTAAADTGSATDTGSGKDTSGESAGCTAVTGAIASNHGHELVMPMGDLTATGDKTYDITGSAGHTHTVTFTEAQRKDIAAGKSIVAASTSSGHAHDVTASCG